MIDLHMHTTYSDGTDSVKEILKNATKANLEILSITDHNSCASYEEMQTFNIEDFIKVRFLLVLNFLLLSVIGR